MSVSVLVLAIKSLTISYKDYTSRGFPVWPVDGTRVQQRAIGVGGWKEKERTGERRNTRRKAGDIADVALFAFIRRIWENAKIPNGIQGFIEACFKRCLCGIWKESYGRG